MNFQNLKQQQQQCKMFTIHSGSTNMTKPPTTASQPNLYQNAGGMKNVSKQYEQQQQSADCSFRVAWASYALAW